MSSLWRHARLLPLLLAAVLTGCGSGGADSASAAGGSAGGGSSGGGSTTSRYPDYNSRPLAADATGMADTAVQIAPKIRIGLNIGNTLEAVGGKSETFWGNPKITREFVRATKAAGFTAIRLPVSWDQYADATTAKIEGAWLDRVKEVVGWCIDADLRVIVNIHWDGGWLEENVTPERQTANVDKQRAFWQQIATHLRDVDGRLMFAGANEPNVKTAEQMAVLMRYHQTFIDAVRATGGRNAWRTLIVQGPSTDVQLTSTLMTGWPTDTVAGRLMAEVHYYTPWGFAGQLKDESWGNAFYYWGAANHSATDTGHNPTWGEEATVDEMFGLMKQRFVDKGIPVIVGEFGAVSRTDLTGEALQLHLASRAEYFKVVTQRALAHGLVPFYWDTGGLLDRTLNTVKDQQALDALMAGAAVP